MATQKQIAQKAGLSLSTVSLALRNHPSIPEKTRKRIKRIAEELNYVPNMAAVRMQALQSKDGYNQGQGNLACLLGYVEKDPRVALSPGFKRAIAGATERAERYGYSLTVFWAYQSGYTPELWKKTFTARNVEGLMLLALQPADFNFDWTFCPSVALIHRVEDVCIDYVTTDVFFNTQLAFREVINAGYKRPGMIVSQHASQLFEKKAETAFTIKQKQLPPPDRIPILSENTDKSLELKQWLSKHQPDVLLVHHRYLIQDFCSGEVERPQIPIVNLMMDTPEQNETPMGIYRNYHYMGEIAVDNLITKIRLGLGNEPKKVKGSVVQGTWVTHPQK